MGWTPVYGRSYPNDRNRHLMRYYTGLHMGDDGIPPHHPGKGAQGPPCRHWGENTPRTGKVSSVGNRRHKYIGVWKYQSL